MNIFWLSKDVTRCAEYHCDKHVVKMCVEYTQILSTAVRVVNGQHRKIGRRNLFMMQGERLREGKIVTRHPHLYLATHHNHPCVVWARENLTNWLTLRKLALMVCAEYTKRYGKVHACEPMLRNMPHPKLPRAALTRPPLTMPEQYHSRNVVTAYRSFYVGAKSRFAVWKFTKVPRWYSKSMSN